MSKSPITISFSLMSIFSGEPGYPFLVVPHAGTTQRGSKVLVPFNAYMEKGEKREGEKREGEEVKGEEETECKREWKRMV